MKIIFFFLSLFVNVAYAQGDVYNLLLSGDTKQLKQAAKMMTKGNQNTPKNASLLAGILEHEFENAPSNSIDALSWGCSALGATGDSLYKPLLQKIYQSKAHRKLRKYAKKAYQRLPSTTLMVHKYKEMQPITSVNLPNKYDTQGLIPKASLTATERKIFAIAKGEWNAIKFISQQLEEIGVSDIKLLDALSQFLIEMHLYNLDNEKIDVLAWICRKLGHSKNGRYKSLLQIVDKQVTNKKLSHYAKSASKALTHSSTMYVIGSVNFKGIIDEFKA